MRFSGGIASATRPTFRLLGPLAVEGVGRTVELTAAKHRTLLALLLLHAGRTVSADVLIEGLWSGRPPASARKLLQVYVSQLRSALGPLGSRLSTRSPGYAFDVEPGELDTHSFETLVGEGRAALADGATARARRSLARSLALWRGPALADFAYEDFARDEAVRLEELRLVALEELLAADLALGRHGVVLAELVSLVEHHPRRERLRWLLMLALYRAGRHAEALESYAEARRVLRDELGLEPGPELRALQQSILRHDPELVAPLESAARTNLPAAVTELVGRDDELEELVELLLASEQRLVTLTGAGGSGKTSLALAAARAVVGEYADGVFLAELAPLRDQELVAAAVAAAVGVEPAPGEPADVALARSLRGRELLLVVDNLEHLPAAAPLLVTLLAAARRLQILATSRLVLHVTGETVFPVAPLAPADAEALFLTRGEAAAPGFSAAAADSALVDEICRRLDRLPLALELAAPWLRTLTLDALCDGLDERLALLTRGPRDLPARQQTLRATIEWSTALLTPDARQLLTRLAVFPGAFDVEAAEAISDDGTVLRPLAELVEANLVRRRPDARLELLETIRELALEQLEQAKDTREVRRRQALYVLEVATSAHLTTEAPGEMRHDLAVREHDGIRAALAWARDAGEVELGLELAFALENFWVTSAPFEGRRWLEDLLERSTEIPPDLRARALRAYGNVLVVSDDPDRGKLAYEESLAAYRELDDSRGIGIMLQRLAFQSLRLGDADDARALCEESLRLHRELGFDRGVSVSLGVLAELARHGGDMEGAVDFFEQSAELAGRRSFGWWRSSVLLNLSKLFLEQGRYAEAEKRLKEVVELAARMNDRRQTLVALAVLARVAAKTERDERAGMLWGAIEAEESQSRVGGWENARADHAQAVLARSGPAFDTGRDHGRRLSLAEAVEVALAD